MSDVLIWYGLCLLLGLAALPLTFAIFRFLPDRGYAFTKPVGLLSVGLLAWWVGNLKLLAFTPLTCWLMIAILAIIGNVLLLVNRRHLLVEIMAWFQQRGNWKLVLATEILFLAAFAFIINLRSFFPALNQSEKFFDYGFINALTSSTSFPLPDPWFDGQPMNYYYGGQFLMAVLSKLSGTEPSTGYNIAMGVVYAMGVAGSFGLASNLVGVARGHKKASLWAGFLGAALVMILGNLYPLRQALQNGLLPIGNSSFPLGVNWPGSARMIYDPMPDGRMLDILTEYPVYSYLNGDLHAHLLDAPFVLLVLGYALNFFAAPAKWVLARPIWRDAGYFVAGGLFVGALYFINGGDFPTYLFLVIVLLALAEVLRGGGWRSIAARFGVQAVGLGAATWLVYVFYFTSFNGMIRGQPIPDVANIPVIGFMSRYIAWIGWPRTRLAEFVQMFGLFLLAILTFYALKTWQVWRDEKRATKDLPFWAQLGVRLIGLIFLVVGVLVFVQRFWPDYTAKNVSLYSAIVPFVAMIAAVWTLWPRAWQELRQRPQLAVEAMALLALLTVGPLLKFELLGPSVFLAYFSLRLAFREIKMAGQTVNWVARLDIFIMVAIALAGGLTLFCELFYVRDIYTNRFNTMFKFWYQMWVLFSFAGTYTMWRVVWWGRRLVPSDVSLALPVTPLPAPVPMRTQSVSSNLFGPLVRLLSPQPQPEVGVGLNQTISQLGFSADGGAPVPPLMATEASHDVPPTQSRWSYWGWRGVWITVVAFLMLCASAIPTLAYWQVTNHYTNRVGLNGEAWYADAFPTEYPAMVWLRNYVRQNEARRGVVLEANGMNYSWGDRISVYTGLPTIVGWPFHELQWRGNLPELDIWNAWLDMDKIYQTTDIQQAKDLLQKHNVRYVFVGQAENGTRSLYSDNREFKKFSSQALAKFSQFMTPIYSDPADNIFIYEVKS